MNQHMKQSNEGNNAHDELYSSSNLTAVLSWPFHGNLFLDL